MLNLYSLSFTLFGLVIGILIFTAAGGPPGISIDNWNSSEAFNFDNNENRRLRRSQVFESGLHITTANGASNDTVSNYYNGSSDNLAYPLGAADAAEAHIIAGISNSDSQEKELSYDTDMPKIHERDIEFPENTSVLRGGNITTGGFPDNEAEKILALIEEKKMVGYPVVSAQDIMIIFGNSILGLVHIDEVYDALHKKENNKNHFYFSKILRVVLANGKQERIRNVTKLIENDHKKLYKKRNDKDQRSLVAFSEAEKDIYEKLINKIENMKAELNYLRKVAEENEIPQSEKSVASEYLKDLEEVSGFNPLVELGYDTVQKAFASYTAYIAKTVEGIDSLVHVIQGDLKDGLREDVKELYYENVMAIFNFLTKDVSYIKRSGILLRLLPSTINEL